MVASSLARSSSRSWVCSQSLFGKVCQAFWQGGDFIKDDEPQGNQVFCQMKNSIPDVIKAMRACVKETGASKLFSANITADDPVEMVARGKYVLSQFGPLGENCAFLVDGYVAGGTAITVARRNFPKQFLHYHRAGHGAITTLRLSAVTQFSSTPRFRASLVPAASMLAP